MTTLGDFTAVTLVGTDERLWEHEGKVVLVVNVAFRRSCAWQLSLLEELWQEYADRGLVVLGFPCDQFGGQDVRRVGAQISATCKEAYGVTFSVYDTVEVTGPDAHPLFRWLGRESRGLLVRRVRWDFTAFLVGRDGAVAARFGAVLRPKALRSAIEALLGQPTSEQGVA